MILGLTRIAKIWSGLGNDKFLAVVDPIIGIKFGQLMLAVAVAEIVIARVCFLAKSKRCHSYRCAATVINSMRLLKHKKRALSYWSAMFVAYSVNASAFARGVEDDVAAKISGDIIVQTFDKGGNVLGNFRAPFHVCVNGGAWQIQVHYGNNYTETCGFDGNEFRSILSYPVANLPGLQGGNKIAVMTTTDYPYQSEPITRFVWMALVARKESFGHDKPMAAIWNMPFHNVQSHLLRSTNVQWMGGERLHLENLDLVEAKFDINQIRTNKLLSSLVETDEISNVLQVIREGGLRASYRVKSSTNHVARLYPVDFELSVFDPNEKGAGQHVVQRYAGHIEQISDVILSSVFPEPSGPTSVHDYRLSERNARVDGISYVITNSWFEATNTNLLNLLRVQVNKAKANLTFRKPKEKTKSITKGFLVTFAAISVGSLFFLLKYLSASQRRESTRV